MVGAGLAQQLVDRINAALAVRYHPNNDLRQNIQRVVQQLQWFDVTFGNRVGQRCGFDKVLSVARVQAAATDFINPMTSTTNALQSAATPGGDCTIMTSSRSPMSMPISSELVATMAPIACF